MIFEDSWWYLMIFPELCMPVFPEAFGNVACTRSWDSKPTNSHVHALFYMFHMFHDFAILDFMRRWSPGGAAIPFKGSKPTGLKNHSPCKFVGFCRFTAVYSGWPSWEVKGCLKVAHGCSSFVFGTVRSWVENYLCFRVYMCTGLIANHAMEFSYT